MDIKKKLTTLLAIFYCIIGCNINAKEIKNKSPNSPTIVGYFSNSKLYDSESDPHESGYSLELYRKKDIFFGKFFVADGMVGDAPSGILENIQFTQSNRKFVFSTKLAFGDDQYTYSFKGFFHKEIIHGILKYQNIKNPKQGLTIEKIILKKKGDAVTLAPSSLKEWRYQNSPQKTNIHP